MNRARGLLLGASCFATLAGFTVAVASTGTASGVTGAHHAGRPISIRAVTTAFVSAPSGTSFPLTRQESGGPLIPAQTVDGVSPNAGASGPGGEQEVIITGSGFTGATDVFFGTLDVNSTAYPCLSSPTGCFDQVSDTEIDADTPVAPVGTGTVDVTVDTGATNGPADDYSYFDPPTVTSVGSPQLQGATGVPVTGTNFSYPDVTPLTDGVSEVDLTPTGGGSTVQITTACTSGTQPDCYGFEDDSDLTVDLPTSMAAGTYDTQVITPGGTSAISSADVVQVLPPGPNLTSVTPPTGSTNGGNNVILAGTNFTGATDVNFGSDDINTTCGTGTCFSVDSDTQITVDNVPSNSAGNVNVNVVTPSGQSGNQTYTYVPPTLTGIAPPSGSTSGGNNVVLTGTSFTGATDVNFGASDLKPSCPTTPCFTINTDTQITVDGVPSHVAGPVNVNVENLGAQSGNQIYTYVAPPTLTGIAPPSGSTGGGNNVVLTGTSFSTATDVNFGPDDISTTCGTGTCFSVDSDTQITVDDVPSHVAGQVDVNVENLEGQSGNQTYTYVPPTLTGIAPPSGSTAGGNNVVLTGTSFTGATDVNFGASDLKPCPTTPCFTINSDTQITVDDVPSHVAGQVNVNVENLGAQSGNQIYTYVPPPTLTGIAPPSGSTGGGNNVVLTGTNFTGATDVNFGPDDINTTCGTGTCFSIDSNTQITVDDAPSHVAGQVNVNVENLEGPSANQTYTYVAPPTLTGIAPPSGSTSGGNSVVLTGTNFTTATDVNFGPDEISTICGSGTCFSIDSNTQITVSNIPAHGAGGVSVNVVNPGGPTAGQTYTYVTPPTLTSLSPPSGTDQGGNNVNLIGTNLAGATDVNFGPDDISTTCGTGTCFTIDNSTEITVDDVPSHSAVGVSVSVVTPGGPSGDVTYTYLGPTLTNLNPPSGSTLGGNNVVLTGSGFTGATDVNFGSTDITTCGTGTCFSVGSDTQITVDDVPANAAGGVSVNVTTPGGTTGNQTYTYVTPAPTLTNMNPSSGTTDEGTAVVLTGTNFDGATAVTVGSIDVPLCGSGACFTITSDTQIAVTMPADTPGSVSVNVTTPGGTTASLQYAYVAPVPAVTGLSPNEGGVAGGTSVTLTGTDFAAAGTPITSKVTVGSAPAITATPCVVSPTAPCFTVNGATSITIGYLPAGTGQVYITVTTPGGTSLTGSSNEYTYNALAPTVSEVSPSDGAMSGDGAISVFGSGFGQSGQDFVTDVFFGTTDIPRASTYPCTTSSSGCFTVVGPTQLAVYTPAGVTAGIVDITVETPLGTSDAGTSDHFTYVAPGAYTAISPVRICDTRPAGPGIVSNQCDSGGNGTLGTGRETIEALITGTHVPSTAQAVVVNITAINHGTSGTYVVAYPTGGSQPIASNINLAGQTVGSNLVIVQLGTLTGDVGKISLFNAVGSADVVVDVEGYFAAQASGPPSPIGAFHSIPPLRVCDSRGNANPALATSCATASHTTSDPLIGGVWRDVVLSGLPPGAASGTPDIPTTSGFAAAAVFNLTATGGTAPTYLSVAVPTAGFTCPSGPPSFSNLNPKAGITLPNRVISNLGPNQDICLFSVAGSINFIIDVDGWFGGSTNAPAGAFFYSVPPTRICDTRSTDGTLCEDKPLTGNDVEPISVAGIVAVPAWYLHAGQPPLAVVANVTAIAGTAPTYFTLYPSDDAPRPTASDLNPSAGEVIANLAITSLSQTTGTGLPPQGYVDLYNAAGDINAILDVAGWFQ